MSTSAFSLIIFGASATSSTSTRTVALASLMLGAVVLGAFIHRQRRLAASGRALLDLGVLTNPQFARSVVVLALTMTAILGVIVLLPQYLTSVRGLAAASVGLMLLPGGILTALGAPLAGRLLDAHGPRTVLLPGTAAITAAIAMLLGVDASTSIGYILTSHLLMSAGVSFVFTPLFASGLNAITEEKHASASTVMNTIQQLAGALGSSLLVTIATLGSSTTSNSMSATSVDLGGFRTAFAFSTALAALTVVAALRFAGRPSPPSPRRG